MHVHHRAFRLTDDRRGFALLSIAVMLGVVTASASVLISYVLTTRNAGKLLEADYDALQIAEAGVQQAIKCLKQDNDSHCGGTYGDSYIGQTDVSFVSGKFSTTVTTDGDGRIIESTGTNATGRTATVRVGVTKETMPEKDTTFDYALQVGDEGLDISPNAEVHNGPIHSNSDIDCGNSSTIDDSIIVAKPGGRITNCEVAGDAYADMITNSIIAGDAYYDIDPTGISGSTVTGTKHPDSVTQLPIQLPEVDLDLWRNAASGGGTISGDYEATDGETFGPIKIEGDLTLGNNVNVTLTGAVWITGNILMENGSSMTLDSSFGLNSTMVLADDPSDMANNGHIVLENGSTVTGSGTDGSYILFVSTNTSLASSDPAIEVSNNASGGIFLSLNGLVSFSPNASAAAIAGDSVFMKNNAIIDYENIGLSPADATFWTGEQGNWRFREHSWQRL